jgi:hypothetical protein
MLRAVGHGGPLPSTSIYPIELIMSSRYPAVSSQNCAVFVRNLYNTNIIPKIVFLVRNRRVTARPNELYELYGR